jgi:hypothetical protein
MYKRISGTSAKIPRMEICSAGSALILIHCLREVFRVEKESTAGATVRPRAILYPVIKVFQRVLWYKETVLLCKNTAAPVHALEALFANLHCIRRHDVSVRALLWKNHIHVMLSYSQGPLKSTVPGKTGIRRRGRSLEAFGERLDYLLPHTILDDRSIRKAEQELRMFLMLAEILRQRLEWHILFCHLQLVAKLDTELLQCAESSRALLLTRVLDTSQLLVQRNLLVEILPVLL